MSKTNDGGPAFPVPAGADPGNTEGSVLFHHESTGMSLRDYFAGQTIQSVVAAHFTNEEMRWSPESWAKHAYLVADAMLKERAKS